MSATRGLKRLKPLSCDHIADTKPYIYYNNIKNKLKDLACLINMNKCNKCYIEKELSLFVKGKNICKDCNNKHRREIMALKKTQQTDNPKTCVTCGMTKTEKDFSAYLASCKECNNNKKKERVSKIKEQISKQNITTQTCIKCNVEQNIDNFRTGEHVCKECTKEKLYEWRINNPQAFVNICKTYRKEHKEEIREKRKIKYNNTPNIQIVSKYRGELREYIFDNRMTEKRQKRIENIIGCSREQLRLWIEFNFKPGMNWENYNTVWNLDHITPCSSFDLCDDVQLRECFNWKNTSPVYCKENLVKFNKTNPERKAFYEASANFFLTEYNQNTMNYAIKKQANNKVSQKITATHLDAGNSLEPSLPLCDGNITEEHG